MRVVDQDFRITIAVVALEELTHKAYESNDPTVEASTDIASAVATRLKGTPVRNTHHMLAESSVAPKRKHSKEWNTEDIDKLLSLVMKARQLDCAEDFLRERTCTSARPSLPKHGRLSMSTINRSGSQSSCASLGSPPSDQVVPLPVTSPQVTKQAEPEHDANHEADDCK